jgi:DNA-binding protein YbaB
MIHKLLLLLVMLCFLLRRQGFLRPSTTFISQKRFISTQIRSTSSQADSPSGLYSLFKQLMSGQRDVPSPYHGGGSGGTVGTGGGTGVLDVEGETERRAKLTDEYQITLARLRQTEITGTDSTGGVIATFTGLGVPLGVKINKATAKKSAAEISSLISEALCNGHRTTGLGVNAATPPELRDILIFRKPSSSEV